VDALTDPFSPIADERGTLLPVEFDDVPFAVRRVFVVHGSDSGAPRGDHEVPCEELVVLLSGTACFRVAAPGEDVRERVLRHRGDALALRPGEHVVYHLDSETAAILVLAAEPYDASADS
jgi:hypothetical protein